MILLKTQSCPLTLNVCLQENFFVPGLELKTKEVMATEVLLCLSQLLNQAGRHPLRKSFGSFGTQVNQT